MNEKLYVISEYIVEHKLDKDLASWLKRGDLANYATQIDPLDMPHYAKIGVGKQCEILGFKTWDVLPHHFVQECIELTGENPVGHVVTVYDGSMFGEFKGITRTGIQLVKIYKHLMEKK